MATKKKALQAAAGNSGEALAIEDVFSTYLYTGNGSTQTITNGIDLAGEGGLVWIKSRDNTYSHQLSDSERNNYSDTIYTNETGGSDTRTGYVTSVSDSGFVLGSGAFVNNSGVNFVSHTFRKASNFFDIVTWTGNGVAGRTIPHNLGGTVGSIWVKATNDSAPWTIWHRSLSNTATNYMYDFGTATSEQTDTSVWNSTAPSDSQITLGTNYRVNSSGTNYVAYIFAHHDGNGTFGETEDQDIIKCGVYQGLNSGDRIELGFEPQFLMIKRRDGGATYGFGMWDTMRGFVNNGDDALLLPGKSDAESFSFSIGHPDATGFVVDAGSSDWITASGEYIYIAIRRGPMRQPESGTEVFVPTAAASFDPYTVGFPTDLFMAAIRGGSSLNFLTADRLRGETKYLVTSSTAAEATDSGGIVEFDLQNSFDQGLSISSQIRYNFRRAPGFFDVVAYTGDGVAGRTVSHNLGVAPEMIWVKRRNSTGEWPVYHKDLSLGNRGLVLQGSFGTYASEYWNSQNPTSTTFPIGASSNVNASGGTYIAYLFATLPGVSKVGSYTGNGTSQTIDCGFTSGARFILIKRTDSTGDWYVWDTERGIVAANDPHLSLNTTAAEVTTDDSVDPDNSGFIVNQVSATNINVSSANYIFYAIA